MRTTEGKPTLETILLGDRQIAGAMADALAAVEVPDRATHGFHTYPAGLNPDAARDLLALFEVDSLYDPFCGGGTLLVEGRIAGLRTVGVDLNPVAVRVARTRTATPDDDTLTTMRSTARALTAVARKAKGRPPQSIYEVVREWYAEHAIWEIESLRRGIAESDPSVRGYLEAILSSILIKTSWRQSDTSPRRVKHRRPRGTTAILFHKRTRELARQMIDLRERVPEGTPESEVIEGAAQQVTVDPVDLVITSPPYPATYDYLPMQHLRRVWLGDRPDEAQELGARREWREGARDAWESWVAGTRAWTARAADSLRPGGHLVVIIGDGLVPAGEIDTSEATEVAAREAGLENIGRASLARPDHARDTVRWEHAFTFRRP